MDTAELTRLAGCYRARLAAQDESQPGYAAAFAQLAARLVAAGGDLVVPPTWPEPDLDRLRADLQVWGPGTAARFQAGEPNGCHANSAYLWLSEEVDAIATGYALSVDGLWRQHSWGVASDGTLVETTTARTGYAGIVLIGDDAWQFALGNLDIRSAVLGPHRGAELAAALARRGASS